ncbi:unnamed protein product [Orchesella dallaii]|uniref:Store-operated calcium entry-associated regulatory factor n=1 Tax=Orchesella dallaii TaxID=48710 RepID=A0ABP1RPP3_9HEXA
MEMLLLRFLFGFCIIFQSRGTSFSWRMWGGSEASDKMRLTDVQVLTLHAGKMTNSKRSPAVAQLRWVGGSANWFFTPQPQVVQCYNRGTDGYDVQASLHHHYCQFSVD